MVAEITQIYILNNVPIQLGVTNILKRMKDVF